MSRPRDAVDRAADGVQQVGRRYGRVLLLLLGTALLGAVLAVVKGRDLDLGYFVGNLSAPYLVAAFLVGRAVRRAWIACGAGVLATWVTLAAFYCSAEVVYGYPTGSMTRYYAEWFLAGTISGAVLGLLGRGSRGDPRLCFVLPAALVLEPLAVAAVQSAGRFGGLHPVPAQLVAWAGEAGVGLLAAAATGHVLRRRRDLAR